MNEDTAVEMEWNNSQFDENLPYIEYSISGFRGSVISGEERRFYVENPMIDSVEILQARVDITGIRVFLRKNFEIDERTEKAITQRVKKFLINICGKMRGEITAFHLKVEEIYEPCKDGHSCYTMHCDIKMKVECSYAEMYKVDVFKEAFESELKGRNADDRYMLLFHAIQIENVTTRYLMLYEILLGIVGKNHKQQEITEFIRDKYNLTSQCDAIDFHQTRKSGKKYKEDRLTYYRNLLGHSEIDEPVDDELIRDLCTRILKVIYYACTL